MVATQRYRPRFAIMGGLDLIIVNLLEDFHVPHLSNLPHSIPKWNKHNVHDVEAIFEFGGAYLHDDVLFLLFFHEITKVQINMRMYAASNDIKILKEWWGVNIFAWHVFRI